MIDINQYIKYLTVQGKKINTINDYASNIKLYFKWFEKTYFKSCVKLLRENIIQYKMYLKEEKYAASTINLRLASLKSLNEYLLSEDLQSEIVIIDSDYIKIQQSFLSPMRITIDEVLEFIQYVLEQGNSRNYAIVMLFAYTGVRISELISIQLDDFSLETSELIIRDGKGEKQRIVYMNNKVIRAIKQYLQERNKKYKKDDVNYLFVSQKKGKLHRSAVNRLFNKYPYDITPHDLRHFFCTNGLNSGLSLIEIRELAGHSSLNTTKKYLHPDKRTFKEKMNKL